MATSPRYRRPNAQKVKVLKDLADLLKAHSIRMTDAANSGHPTSCCSLAEIMSVLFFNTMRYKVGEPRCVHSDRLVLSKGHAAPILYAAWSEAGLIPEADLMGLRLLESELEGHPTPKLDFIDVATGSLGQGLGCAAGMAYVGKYFDKASYRVYCVMGDGETAEGSVWEALAFCSHYKLDNITAIIDCNRLGQSAPTALQHDTDTYRRRLEAFGWNVSVVNGHDIVALTKALHDAAAVKGKPSCIVAKTVKAKGCKDIEDKLDWHGKAVGQKATEFLEKVSKIKRDALDVPAPLDPVEDAPVVAATEIKMEQPPAYSVGEKHATRVGYGNALVKMGKDTRVVVLDGDMSNSTQSERFKNAFPERFIECFIAEQNMTSVAMGCATRARCTPFLSTFGVFFSRAMDQIRVAAISQSNINFCGSHCGLSAAGDGPTQMALEDIALFRSLPGSTIFYPSDVVAAEQAVQLAANHEGICYIRTTKVAMPVIYGNEEEFAIGKAKVLRKSSRDKVTVIACCATLVEALATADDLVRSGVNIRVIDPFTIRPLDVETMVTNATETGGNVVVVEDHYVDGGIGEAVTCALQGHGRFNIKHLAVREIPHCGEHAALLERYGLSSEHITRAVQELLH